MQKQDLGNTIARDKTMIIIASIFLPSFLPSFIPSFLPSFRGYSPSVDERCTVGWINSLLFPVLLLVVEVLLYIHKNRRFIRDGSCSYLQFTGSIHTYRCRTDAEQKRRHISPRRRSSPSERAITSGFCSSLFKCAITRAFVQVLSSVP